MHCPYCRYPLEYTVYYTATVHSQVSFYGSPGHTSRNVVDAIRSDHNGVQYSDLDIDFILCVNCKRHLEEHFDKHEERFDGNVLTIKLSDVFVMENYLD